MLNLTTASFAIYRLTLLFRIIGPVKKIPLGTTTLPPPDALHFSIAFRKALLQSALLLGCGSWLFQTPLGDHPWFLAPVVLARAGLLRGLDATVWPSANAVDEVRRAGGQLRDDAVVCAGRIITGRGPEAAELWAQAIMRALSP